MGIKRYIASKDTTITNAFKEDLSTRAVDANMGESDSLEVFSIYGQSKETVNTYGPLTSSVNSLLVPLSAGNTTSSFAANLANDGQTVHKMWETKLFSSADGDRNSLGAVYVFNRTNIASNNEQTWTLETRITASDAIADDYFGSNSFDRVNNQLIIGSNGNSTIGKLYIFHSASNGWQQDQILTASNGQASDYLGTFVDISGNLAVGAAAFRSNAPFSQDGAVYTFKKISGIWIQNAMITSSFQENNGNFGWTTLVQDENTIIASAYNETISGSSKVGSVYILRSGSLGWTTAQRIVSPRITDFVNFGYNIRLINSKLYIVADGYLNSNNTKGAIFIYHTGSAGWIREGMVIPPISVTDKAGTTYQTFTETSFGWDFDQSGNTMVVGVPYGVVNSVSGGVVFVYNSGSTGWNIKTFITGTNNIGNQTFGSHASVFSGSGVLQIGAGGFHGDENGSNNGSAHIYVNLIDGTEELSTKELSRILIQFPVEQIVSDRVDGKIPAAGLVNFNMKMSNAVHPLTLPKKFTISVQPVTKDWLEGSGLDMEKYLDNGYANWMSASNGDGWSSEGADFDAETYTQYFEKGTEDLLVNITPLVESWIDGSRENYGVIVKLIADNEQDGESFYTKKFFARGSEFFFKKPWIEAQFDSSRVFKDDRGSFYNSSSLAPAAENLNTLFLYNRHRGQLVDIPAVGTGNIFLSLYSGSIGPSDPALTLHNGATAATGSWVSTGIYSAQVALHTTVPYVFDVWHANNGTQFFTGSAITILDPTVDEEINEIPEYVLSIKNLKQSYSNEEVARFNLFVREKNWSPTIYTVASQPSQGVIIEDAYFKLYRISDNLQVIPYGTGSMNHTRLSFDKTANYFDLDMSLLEAGYSYGLKFVFYNAGNYYEQRELFKFRVDD